MKSSVKLHAKHSAIICGICRRNWFLWHYFHLVFLQPRKKNLLMLWKFIRRTPQNSARGQALGLANQASPTMYHPQRPLLTLLDQIPGVSLKSSHWHYFVGYRFSWSVVRRCAVSGCKRNYHASKSREWQCRMRRKTWKWLLVFCSERSKISKHSPDLFLSFFKINWFV